MRINLVLLTSLILAVIVMGSQVFGDYQLSIIIDGKEIKNDLAPNFSQERQLLPIKFITEKFGGDFSWIEETLTLEIYSPSQKFISNFEEMGGYIKKAADVLSMSKENRVTILDVRNDELRARSLINDSQHIPLIELLSRIDEIPKGKTVAVYCDKNIHAAYGVMILNFLGYEAYLLENGINAWLTAGGRATFFSH